VRPDQIELVQRRAKQFRGVNIVVDHLGLAPSGTEKSIDALRSLAKYQNVSVKISALSFLASSASESATLIAATVVRDSFGPERVVFGSDWPYSKENVEWSGELTLLGKALGPRADESGLLGANAARLWGFGK
jgi:L-fuconolactonase